MSSGASVMTAHCWGSTWMCIQKCQLRLVNSRHEETLERSFGFKRVQITDVSVSDVKDSLIYIFASFSHPEWFIDVFRDPSIDPSETFMTHIEPLLSSSINPSRHANEKRQREENRRSKHNRTTESSKNPNEAAAAAIELCLTVIFVNTRTGSP